MQLYNEIPTLEDRIKKIRQDLKVQEKAKQREQQTFTLVEQDRSAPSTIAYWILQNIETAPAAKLYDALESAILMRAAKGRKDAD
jgi:hypothetical protein